MSTNYLRLLNYNLINVNASTINYSTMIGSTIITNSSITAQSTIIASTIIARNINYSTLTGSTFTSQLINFSTLSGSTLTSQSINYSTLSGSTLTSQSINYVILNGSTINTNTLFINSTLTGSTINTNTLNYSTLTGSTINTNTLNYLTLTGSTINYSTLRGSTITSQSINYVFLTGSTINTNTLVINSSLTVSNFNLNTLTGSTINTNILTGSTITTQFINYSTLRGSTINANILNGSTITAQLINYSTLSGSTLSSQLINTNTLVINSTLIVSSLITNNNPVTILTSSMISIGASTNTVYTSFAKGNYLQNTNWLSTINTLSSAKIVAMSGNAQTQLIITQVSTATSIYYTSTIGLSWSAISNATGLPVATETNYSAGAVSRNGQYALLGTSNGNLYITSSLTSVSGISFTNINPIASYIYMPFNGSIIDVNGNSIPTSPATIPYGVGITHAQAAWFNNTGGIPTYYIQVPWNDSLNYSITGWFKATSYDSMQLLSGFNSNLNILLQTGNIYVNIPYNGTTTQMLTSPGTYLINQWYNFIFIFQTNNTCSFYLNNNLIGTKTHIQGSVISTTSINFGVSFALNSYPFVGYMNNISIYNSAIPYTPIVTNFNKVAISNSGQYIITNSIGDAVYISSDYGISWLKSIPVNASWRGLAISSSGQYMISSQAANQFMYSLNYGLSWNTLNTITIPVVAISGNGQYALGANSTRIYIVNNYLVGFSTNTYINPVLFPAITVNNIPVAADISQTGQYMVLITNNILGPNVYYSTNYGSNFIGLTLSFNLMTSCSISSDGFYISVSNSTTVFQLNNNSAGYSVAVGNIAGLENQYLNAIAIGNQAGQQNQGQNAIAIGNYAGQINQLSNSIILNASGSAVNSSVSGFYVTPIAQYGYSSSTSFNLLAYGKDNQIVQAIPILITTTPFNPTLILQSAIQVNSTIYTSTTANASIWMQSNGSSLYITDSSSTPSSATTTYGRYFGLAGTIYQDFFGSYLWRSSSLDGSTVTNIMNLTSSGNLYITNNVGIGTNISNTRITVITPLNGDVSKGILVINNKAEDSTAKTTLNGLNYASLMPAFSGSSVFFYGTNVNIPYKASLTTSVFFTGQHANQPIDSDLKTNIQNYVGFIVSSADQGYYSINPVTNEIITGSAAIMITEALPYISITTIDQDPAVWGVLTNVRNENTNTDGTMDTDNNTVWGDRLKTMVRVNGLGEGAIWVTNINGNINNGDFICSSIIPGHGRKQNNDLMHNYTVAKATMSCNFNLNNTNLYKCKTIKHNNITYIAAFIGCTYHCS